MAEAIAILGIVGNVVQIVDFAARLGSRAYQLLQAGSDAFRVEFDIKSLKEELQVLKATIKSAEALTKAAPSDNGTASRDKVVSCARRCRAEAKVLIDMLERLRMTTQASGVHRVIEGTQKAARYLKSKKAIERQHKSLSEMRDKLMLALQVASKDTTQAVIDRILSNLRFDGIEQRERSIHEVFPQTYEWALEDDNFGLRSWLIEDKGMFWITGKAGSGKSTLMKFIRSDPRSTHLLQQWAGNTDLVICHFYFWYLGNHLQTSIEGLLRSVLCQIITTLPGFAQVAWPERFQHFNMYQWAMKLDQDELISALKRIAFSKLEDKGGKRICLFIDGLDEFRGDHIQLIQVLYHLSQHLAIKMCVSSRPWTVFNRAYESNVPYIRLEDITRPDILLYTHNHVLNSVSAVHSMRSSNLEDDEGYENNEVRALVDGIVDKAEGVFLWVYLVVRDVRQGVAAGDSLAMLHHRVKAFPSDLDEFFRKLVFERVDSIYLRQTCQTLSLAMRHVESGDSTAANSSFIDYWLILQHPEGLGHSDFAYDLVVPKSDWRMMVRVTQRALGAACKDLLVLQSPNSSSPQVTLLHRTIYDFLSTRSISEQLRHNTPEFFWSESLLHLMALARLRILHGKDKDHERIWNIAKTYLERLPSSLGKRYVDTFCDHLPTNITAITFPPLSLNAACVLLECRQYAVFGWWAQVERTRWQDKDIPKLLDVALGEPHGTGLTHFADTDLHVLDLVLGLRSGPAHLDWVPARKESNKCAVTAWQKFLQQLQALYDHVVGDEEMNPGSQELDRWARTAAAFLHAQAPVTQEFCSAQEHAASPHVHRWQSAHRLLSQICALTGSLALQDLGFMAIEESESCFELDE